MLLSGVFPNLKYQFPAVIIHSYFFKNYIHGPAYYQHLINRQRMVLTKLFNLFTLIIAMLLLCPMVQAQTLIPIFQPADSTGWHVYTSRNGHADPESVFRFEDGMIHVSGQDFGYLITNKPYANFHLIVEFKWGEKKYPPRENAKRDAGILYHTEIYNGDKIWPRSLEFQIQEGDCGDFWMTDSTTITHNDTLTTMAAGAFRVEKTKDAEKPNGEWNVAEIIVKEGHIVHMLNRQMVNYAMTGNTSTGFIVLQSEGAEIFYRKPRIREY